jgi:hypothetical protein
MSATPSFALNHGRRVPKGMRCEYDTQLGHPRGGLFSVGQKAVKTQRRWREDELKHARDMRAAGYSYREIDKTLGRFPGATQQRLEIAGHGSGRHVSSHRVTAGLLAERDALAVAREQHALTGNFCGDPPPGYSALHGKTGLR